MKVIITFQSKLFCNRYISNLTNKFIPHCEYEDVAQTNVFVTCI